MDCSDFTMPATLSLPAVTMHSSSEWARPPCQRPPLQCGRPSLRVYSYRGLEPALRGHIMGLAEVGLDLGDVLLFVVRDVAVRLSNHVGIENVLSKNGRGQKGEGGASRRYR